jgi:hypothetical protein
LWLQCRRTPSKEAVHARTGEALSSSTAIHKNVKKILIEQRIIDTDAGKQQS